MEIASDNIVVNMPSIQDECDKMHFILDKLEEYRIDAIEVDKASYECKRGFMQLKHLEELITNNPDRYAEFFEQQRMLDFYRVWFNLDEDMNVMNIKQADTLPLNLSKNTSQRRVIPPLIKKKWKRYLCWVC